MKFLYIFWLVAAVNLVGISGVVRAYEEHYCKDLSPLNDVNIDLIMGTWHGVEYISHNPEHRVGHSDICFNINIEEAHEEPTTTSRYQLVTPEYPYGRRPFEVPPEHRYRHLLLQWNEGIKQVDYHVKLNMSRRGFWQSSGPVNGVQLAEMYNHFAGTVQVLMAANNHLLLTFCQRLPDSQLFSVLLSRSQNHLSEFDVIDVHGLLSRKNLSTSSLRKVCTNGAAPFTSGLHILFLVFAGLAAGRQTL